MRKQIVIRNGYRYIYMPEHPRAEPSHGYVREHILIALKALGKPLPEGVEVHHFDENRSNNANTNLVICQDASYHKLLHFRQRIAKAGGDPNTQKLCSSCKEIKYLGAFAPNANQKVDGLRAECRECRKTAVKAQNVRAYIKRKLALSLPELPGH